MGTTAEKVPFWRSLQTKYALTYLVVIAAVLALLCALCGQEITEGEEYWFCSGSSVCAGCLPDLARRELAPCREIRGREAVR